VPVVIESFGVMVAAGLAAVVVAVGLVVLGIVAVVLVVETVENAVAGVGLAVFACGLVAIFSFSCQCRSQASADAVSAWLYHYTLETTLRNDIMTLPGAWPFVGAFSTILQKHWDSSAAKAAHYQGKRL